MQGSRRRQEGDGRGGRRERFNTTVRHTAAPNTRHPLFHSPSSCLRCFPAGRQKIPRHFTSTHTPYFPTLPKMESCSFGTMHPGQDNWTQICQVLESCGKCVRDTLPRHIVDMPDSLDRPASSTAVIEDSFRGAALPKCREYFATFFSKKQKLLLDSEIRLLFCKSILVRQLFFVTFFVICFKGVFHETRFEKEEGAEFNADLEQRMCLLCFLAQSLDVSIDAEQIWRRSGKN